MWVLQKKDFVDRFVDIVLYEGGNTEAYLEPSRNLRSGFFAKIINGCKPLTIFAKIFIVDFWLCSKYASVIGRNLLPHWLYLPSNNEPIACSSLSVFWCFASWHRKKQPPEVINNVFKHFAKFTQKYLCRSLYISV